MNLETYTAYRQAELLRQGITRDAARTQAAVAPIRLEPTRVPPPLGPLVTARTALMRPVHGIDRVVNAAADAIAAVIVPSHHPVPMRVSD